jgi:hypothetical protein
MIIGNFAPVSVPKLANWRRSVYTWLLVNIQNRFWMNTHGQTSLSGSESHRLFPPRLTTKKKSHNKKKEFANTRTRNPTHMLTNKDLQYTMLQTPPLSQLTRQSIDHALYAGILILWYWCVLLWAGMGGTHTPQGRLLAFLARGSACTTSFGHRSWQPEVNYFLLFIIKR